MASQFGFPLAIVLLLGLLVVIAPAVRFTENAIVDDKEDEQGAVGEIQISGPMGEYPLEISASAHGRTNQASNSPKLAGPANLPFLLRAFRDVAEDLKMMGSSSTDRMRDGNASVMPASMLESLLGSNASVVPASMLESLLGSFRGVAEDLKRMGSQPRSSTGKPSLVPAAMIEEGKDSETTSSNTDKTVALLLTLVLMVFLLCRAAPGDRDSQNDNESQSWVRLLRLPFYIGAWMTLSAGLTIFNKWMFMPSGGDFPYVATLTWCHMLSATILTRVLQYLQPGLFPAVSKNEMSAMQLARLVVPVALLQPFTLVLGNTAYLYLSVSYIQMIKAAMPGMVFIISAMIGLEKFSVEESFLLAMLGLGVAGCSHGELEFSWVGLAYQMSSFFCEALRIITLKLTVSGSSGSLDPLSALFYIAPCNLVGLTGPILRELQHLDTEKIFELRYVLGANCLTAFGLNIAGVCLMSLASAVTFTVCGLLKDFGLILGAALIFGNKLTTEEMIGTFIVIGSATLFQRYQKQKSKAK